MGFVSFAELTENSGSVNSTFQRNYTKSWLIETDDPTMSVWDVGSHPSLPKIFDLYPQDPTGRTYCVSLAPTQDPGNPKIWKVVASFTNAPDGWVGGVGAGSYPTGNPLIDSQNSGTPPSQRNSLPNLRPRDYSYSTAVAGQEVIKYYKDSTGATKPILNSADDPFANPPTRTIPAVQITVGLNSLQAPGGNWAAALHKLNQNALTIDQWTIPAKWARLESCSAQRVYEEGLSYYRWTIHFLIRETWKWTTLSMGNRAYVQVKNKATGATQWKKRSITEIDGYLTGPQLLDCDGRLVTSAAGNTACKLEFDIYEAVVFPSPL